MNAVDATANLIRGSHVFDGVNAGAAAELVEQWYADRIGAALAILDGWDRENGGLSAGWSRNEVIRRALMAGETPEPKSSWWTKEGPQ